MSDAPDLDGNGRIDPWERVAWAVLGAVVSGILLIVAQRFGVAVPGSVTLDAAPAPVAAPAPAAAPDTDATAPVPAPAG